MEGLKNLSEGRNKGVSLGQRIRNRRKELGLTQKELGRRLNVSQQVVARWEHCTNINSIRFTTLERISKELDTEVADLTDGVHANDSLILSKGQLNAITIPELNEKGMEKLLEFAELLAKIPEYRGEVTK